MKRNNQSKAEKLQTELKKVKKELNIYKWGYRKSKQGLTKMYGELKENERMKSDFLSIAAHQLRTPLGIMRWNIEMLISGEIGELSLQAKSTLQQVFNNNQRLIQLVNNLLNVSRIEERRLKYTPKLTQPEEIVCKVIKNLDSLAKDKKIKITFKKPKTPLPKIKIDPDKLLEIIMNLISNAIKYTNKKNQKVEIDLSAKEKTFILSVKNSGIGIAKKEKERIFTKFFRSNEAIKRETEGSGLGLFVVKSYVEAWGGKVWFESEEGKETTFYVELPVEIKKGKLNKNLITNDKLQMTN